MTTADAGEKYLDPEGLKVGPLLKVRRDNLEITRAELYRALPSASQLVLEFAEVADHPSPDTIDLWWKSLAAAAENSLPWANASVGWRSQWYATAWDMIMAEQVSKRDRRTAWWWGASKRKRPAGAWCYLCGQIIRSYDVASGVTAPVRRAVMDHRAAHIGGAITSKLSDTKESAA